MFILVLEIINFLVLALLLGTVLGFLMSRSMVRDVRTAVEQLKLDVAGHNKRLGAAETDLQLHKSSLNELRAAYDGLQERLSVHSDRQADLSGQMEGLVAARSALSERTANLANQLAEVQAGLGRQVESVQQALSGRLDGFATERDAYAQRIIGVEDATARLADAYHAQAQHIESFTALRDTPANDAFGQNPSLPQFAERVTAVETQLADLGRDINASVEQFGVLTGRQTDAETRLTELRSRVEVLTEADSVLSARLESVAGLPLKLTGFEEEQQDIKARMKTLETLPVQVDGQRGQIEHLQSATAALSTRLEHQDRWGQETDDRVGAIEANLLSATTPPPSRVSPSEVPARPSTTPELPVATTDIPTDDLTRIRGVGVAIERKLNAAGVHRFEQIAGWTKQEIEQISGLLGKFQGRIVRDDWIAQAKALLAERAPQDHPSPDRPHPQPEYT